MTNLGDTPLAAPASRRLRWCLALATALAGACGHAPPAPRPHRPGPHFGNAWFEARGAALGLSAAEARARDRALPTDAPPADAWDAQTAAEAAGLWSELCASCHGARGRLEGVPPETPMPRTWGGLGATMGFTFGGDRMRAGLYRRIAEGGETKDGRASRMPPWASALAREQIWALVAFIERL